MTEHKRPRPTPPHPGTIAALQAAARRRHEELHGLPWYRAPLPRRWHRCQSQQSGWVTNWTFVEHCACGAIRFDGGGRWMGRNSRRKGSG